MTKTTNKEDIILEEIESFIASLEKRKKCEIMYGVDEIIFD